MAPPVPTPLSYCIHSYSYSLSPRALSPTHVQFLHMTFGSQETKNRSDVKGREKVERTRLCVGGQTHKQTVAHVFVQSPVTCRCTAMYILLACRKAIPSLTVACNVEYIYDLCMHTYIVRGASTLSVYVYSTYYTGQYPPRIRNFFV